MFRSNSNESHSESAGVAVEGAIPSESQVVGSSPSGGATSALRNMCSTASGHSFYGAGDVDWSAPHCAVCDPEGSGPCSYTQAEWESIFLAPVWSITSSEAETYDDSVHDQYFTTLMEKHKADLACFALTGRARSCQHCGHNLRPINGDWETRRYHGTCREIVGRQGRLGSLLKLWDELRCMETLSGESVSDAIAGRVLVAGFNDGYDHSVPYP